MACACGHAQEEHGGDPEYPGSMACRFSDPKIAEEAGIEECDCAAFDGDDEDGDE